jgi:hypothetical protein
MGPPSLNAKLKALHKFTGGTKGAIETKKASQILANYTHERPQLKAQLELYTFSEFGSLIKGLSAGYNSLRAALQSKGVDKVAEYVKIDSKTAGLQLRDLKPIEKLKPSRRFDTIAQIKRLDINRDELEPAGVKKETLIIQYVIDRRQSRVPRE